MGRRAQRHGHPRDGHLIREQQFKFKQGQIKIEKLPDSFAGKSQLHDFQLNTWISDVIEPWSLAFLPGPGNKAIVTEKLGYAYLIDNGKRAARRCSASRPSIPAAKPGSTMSSRTPTTRRTAGSISR